MLHATTTRRAFLAAPLAGLLATVPLAAAAQQELKLATFVPPTHIIQATVLTPWAQDLAQASTNKLAVRMFPSMQLGGKAPELYRQMAQGISDITFTLPGYTSSSFPMMALTELPGMAEDGPDGTRKLWQHFDRFLAPQFTEAKVLMLWNADNAILMSKTKLIRKLEDLRGLKVRTPSAAQSAQIEALGASPIDMPANQMYNALDRGVVDVLMVPPSVILDFKIGEVARYYTVGAPLGRSNFLVAMNKARYDRLPAESKAAIDRTTGLQLSLKGAQTYESRSAEAMRSLAGDGKSEVITLDQAERARFRAAFRPLVEAEVAEKEKMGLPARAMIAAFGLGS
ncbi:MAG: TRAP transporter substrate-binding protein [Alphaproteobacteria bacterium]|nr:TRAP transporter substrate-binding protein [Alphaproteobacteria bacterium]